jgi:2-phosphosulfolactate phosphatase
MRSPYDVRFEWGPAGAAALAPSSSCLVVVDVLSFSTSVTVAVEAGTRVYPYAWRDETAAAFARERQAELAVGRRAVSADRPWSLSPAALRRAPFTEGLVLPSPNGSEICASAVGAGVTVIAGCLRNASAVARYLREHGFLRGRYLPGGHGAPGPVTVIAAGERWPDGSLRLLSRDWAPLPRGRSRPRLLGALIRTASSTG